MLMATTWRYRFHRLRGRGAGCAVLHPSYPEEIAAHRAEIDGFMRGARRSHRSRRRSARRSSRCRITPPTSRTRVPAALRVARGDEIIEMSTSTGKPRRMRRIGTLAFTPQGPAADPHRVCRTSTTPHCGGCSCRSATSPVGIDTYQGGRYLDSASQAAASTDSWIPIVPTIRSACSILTYERPVPPRENRLKAPITRRRAAALMARSSAPSSSTSTACSPTPKPLHLLALPGPCSHELGIALESRASTTRTMLGFDDAGAFQG